PFNLSVNEDCGMLVEGFESQPAILTSHAPPWAGDLLETCGYRKAMDLYAFRMRPDDTPDQIHRLAQLASRSGRVRIRNLEMSRFREEVALACEIFNDAWSENWGFVPFAQAEIQSLARDLRPILRSKFAWFVEIDGKPSAFMVVLPDVNRLIAPFDGRLLPFNWARLAHEIWRDRWKTARVPLMGLRKAYQKTAIGPAVLSLLVAELIQLGRGYDLDWVEFSWVLESNQPMLSLARLTAGAPVKTYRLYEREISD
ncbi:MAG: dATP pyrophosphohydrolase, partial [Hyphomicrobiaceae bacterium]